MGIIKTVKGLKSLLIADIPVSGKIADAEFHQLALNLEGTVKVNQEEDSQTDINVEEQDAPLDTILKKGKFMFESDIPDMQYSVAHEILGAEKKENIDVEGGKVTRVYIPDSAQYIYKMLKIVPKDGIEQLYFTRAQISAYITGNLSKTETLNVHLKATALIPLKGETNSVCYDIIEGTNHGYILGLPLAVDTDWISTWGAVASGDFKITVDNGTPVEVTALDFSSIEGGQDVVNILNANTDGVTWSWDEDAFRFKVTSNSAGSTSTVELAAVTSPNTDLRVKGLLNMINSTPVAGS